MKSAARHEEDGSLTADLAVDKIRDRFGWKAVEYGSALGLSARS
jgi:hypothetical protein